MDIQEFNVIIIGGGVTGAGLARDCSLRGLKVLLLERSDLTNGASGRNHGTLHSGSRYAVTDEESARECIVENRILRKIASNCVEETEGLSITLPEDDPEFRKIYMDRCRKAGIEVEEIDPKEALLMEPSVNPSLTGAVKMPDASVDPFRLCSANALDAAIHGATIRTYCEVTGFIKEGGAIVGVKAYDKIKKETVEFRAQLCVNAAGIWSQKIAALAGSEIRMLSAKGSLLVYSHRVNNMIITRCRKPSNADLLVPADAVCVIGTTSDKIPLEECDDIRVTPQEVDLLMTEGCKLAPCLAQTRILRAYGGVRPLVAANDDPTGRNTSRGLVLIDHETRDGIPGLISITGGKLTIYRLMAEKTTDLICRKLNVNAVCETAGKPLPGSERHSDPDEDTRLAFKAAEGRHGARVSRMDFSDKSEVLCECEHVTRAEIAYAVKYLDVNNLIDLRRRTRVGMGTCQGTFCMKRVAKALADELGCPEKADEFVRGYVVERWKGLRPIAWGDSLREAEFMRKKIGGDSKAVLK